MPDIAVVLVDYDNVKLIRDELTEGDVANNLAEVIPATVAEAARIFGAKEVAFRVYGGWLDEHGVHSYKAQWLLTGLSWYRGRHSGAIVKPTLVTALACRTADQLVGTVRSGRRGHRQKMVDTMIVVDTLHYCRDELLPVMLFSDDDDLLPAAIAATAVAPSTPIHWLRRRGVGTGLNDDLLVRANVSLGVAPGEE